MFIIIYYNTLEICRHPEPQSESALRGQDYNTLEICRHPEP